MEQPLQQFQSDVSFEQSVNAVTDAVLAETANAMGVKRSKLLISVIRRLFRKSARNFAEVWAGFNHSVSKHSVLQAAQETLRNFICRYHIYGEEHIPSEGPVTGRST